MTRPSKTLGLKPSLILTLTLTLSLILILGAPGLAEAHISIVSGVGVANATQEITFGVGHGCAGADTYRVRVEIPDSVTSVRPETSGFGRTTVEKNAAGIVTGIVWQKADADALPADLEYYKLTVRIKVPNSPFTTIYFPAHQTCRAADGTLSVVDWSMSPGGTSDADAGTDEPAPALSILPAHFPGWNQFTVAAAVTDLKTLFPDALIVWKGTAAYSVNPATVALINGTAGVTALSALAASDVIWVKY